MEVRLRRAGIGINNVEAPVGDEGFDGLAARPHAPDGGTEPSNRKYERFGTSILAPSSSKPQPSQKQRNSSFGVVVWRSSMDSRAWNYSVSGRATGTGAVSLWDGCVGSGMKRSRA